MTGSFDDQPAKDPGPEEITPEDELVGSTSVLTDEGWETALYVEPTDDWVLQPDGSYASPDGTMRSWPPGTPIE